MTCMAACPHRSMLSRTSPVKPIRSATTSRGRARARESMASKEPCSTRSATRASAFSSICARSPRRARGVRFSVSAARRRVCSGGSLANEVPVRASLTIGLNPMEVEEKVS